MKNNLLLACFLTVFLNLNAQTGVSYNLALRNMLASEKDLNKEMFLLVKGEAKAIRHFINESGGKVLNSAGDIVSVRCSLRVISLLVKQPFVKSIGSNDHHYTLLNDTMRMRSHVNEVYSGQSPLTHSYTGRGVLMGIIDSGIDYNHPDFKDSTGHTRVKWLWDMNLPVSGNTPLPYGYGQEFSQQQIDSGNAPADTISYLYGHGTYVSGIAAGNGSATGHFRGVAPEAEIIVVGFKFHSQDTLPLVAHAVEYIFNKAQQLGKPCVINASLGEYEGSHDGLDLESQYISNLINLQPGRVVVAAAGNLGVLYPIHVGRNSIAGDTVFTWAKYNPGYAAVYYHIYADTAAFRNVRFSIGADKVNPYYSFRGKTSFTNVFPSINHPTALSLYNGTRRLGIMQFYTTINEGVYDLEVIILPDSTDYFWRFITTGNGRYDSWSFDGAQTDWISQNLPSSSVFPDIIHYQVPDTTQSIVGGFTCLDNVITVGNYYNTDRHIDINSVLQVTPADLPQRIAENSSRGPTRDGRIKPEITAPGHHIISDGVLTQLPGLIAAQPYKVAPGGFHITGGGTSASSPVVAGVAALYLEQNPNATWLDVKNALTNCASQDSFMWGPYPNNAWGYGKVNAFNALTTCALTINVDEVDYGNRQCRIYPNPASTELNIEVYGSDENKITVFDIDGRKLILGVYPGKFTIPVASLVAGVYFLEVQQTGKTSVMKKFVISR